MRNLFVTRSAVARSTALLLSLVFGAGVANAHALLDHADPRVGNTVKRPQAVSLWFTQNLESGFSSIEVVDSSGTPVHAGKAAVSGKMMRVPVKALAAGTYTVRWHVLSVDTHTTEGNFTFTVSP
jgi:methionine-rich copper-binding protein CopC